MLGHKSRFVIVAGMLSCLVVRGALGQESAPYSAAPISDEIAVAVQGADNGDGASSVIASVAAHSCPESVTDFEGELETEVSPGESWTDLEVGDEADNDIEGDSTEDQTVEAGQDDSSPNSNEAPANLYDGDEGVGGDGDPGVLPEGSISLKEPFEVLGISLSEGSVVSRGTTVVVAPQTKGFSNEARFNYVWNYEGAWSEWGSTQLEQGGPTSEESWEFTPGKTGFYDIYVDVIVGDAVETFSTRIEVTRGWELMGFEASASQITVGNPLDVSVLFSVDSETEDLRFNYVWQRDDWASWGSSLLDGEYEDTSVHTYMPDAPGVYMLYVDVVDTDGYTVTRECAVNVVEPGTLMALSASSILLEDSCMVELDVPEGAEGYTYNFGWQREGSWAEGDWSSTVLETGSRSADHSWTFTPGKSGKYRLFADIVSPDGSVRTVYRDLEVDRGWEVEGITVEGVVDSLQVGDTIVFSPQLKGVRTDRVHFNYVWQRDDWADWDSTIRWGEPYTAVSAESLALTHSGIYTLAVDVVDCYSGEMVCEIISGLRVDRAWNVEGLIVDGLATSGGSVTLVPQLSGNTEGLTFNYVWDRNNWSDWWSTQRDGLESVAASQLPCVLGPSGWYRFYVDVTDANGETETVATDAYWVDDSSIPFDRVVSVASTQLWNTDGRVYEDAVLAAGGRLCYDLRNYWCGAYLWWSFDKAGVGQYYVDGTPLVEPRLIVDWYAAQGQYSADMRGVQPGDFVFFDYHNLGYASHIGYCVGKDDWGFTVIEGNTPMCRVARYSFNEWFNTGYAHVSY